MEFGYKKALSEVLLDCACMSDYDRLKAVVSNLPKRIGITLSHSNALIFNVHNLLEVCSNQQGGIEELIEVVEHFEQNPAQTNKLKPMWLAVQLCQLLEPINLDKEKLYIDYQQSLPKMYTPSRKLEKKKDGLLVMVELLFEAPKRRDNTHPLITFIDKLFRYIDGTLQTAVLDWQEKAADHLGINLSTITIPTHKLKQVSPEKGLHLLILLFPNEAMSNTYKQTIYFWNNDELLYRDQTEQVIHEPELTIEINQAIKRVKEQNPKLPLYLEFLLPNEAITTLPVDQWPTKNMAGKASKLGMEYYVMVRSLTRNETPSSDWSDRWQFFEQNPTKIQIDAPQNSISSAKLRKRKNIKKCCFGLVNESMQETTAAVIELIAAGIPIAVWPRRCDLLKRDIDGVVEKINSLLQTCNLSELPLDIRDERLTDDNDELGNFLTLMWDNPDRIPSKKALIAT